MKLPSRQVAIVAIFAALYAVVSRLPGIPIIGAGTKIEFVVILDPIVGILLGPWVGGLTSFLGNFIAWIIPSSTVYGLLNLPTGPVTAMVSGNLARSTKSSNWKFAVIIYAVLMGLWYLTPPGQEVLYYPFLHWTAFALILIFRGKIQIFLNADRSLKKVLGTIMCCFGGIMANSMTGNLIFIGSVGWFVSLDAVRDALRNVGFFWVTRGLKLPGDPLAAIFAAALPLTVAERLVLVVFVVYLAYGLMIALKKSGMMRQE